MANILLIQIAIMSTAIVSFVSISNGMNYLFIASIIFTVLFFSKFLLTKLSITYPIYITLLLILISVLINFQQIRLSSLLYTITLILNYIILINLIYKECLSISLYISLVKLILYSYFVVLLLQQVQFYFLGHSDYLNQIFSNGLSFNALATEPSYAATVIAVLFYSYIKFQRIEFRKSNSFSRIKIDKLICFLSIYSLLTLGSSYGILYLLVLIISLIKFNAKNIFYIFILLFFICGILVFFDFSSFQRILNTFSAITLFDDDYTSLINTDHSAAVRIIPVLYLFSHIELITLFGLGMDYSLNFFPTIILGVEDGSWGGGFIPSFIIDYGLFNIIIILVIFKKFCFENIFCFSSFIMLITSFNTSLNSQLFWFLITIFSINNFLLNRVKTV
jgi:hypothetical protein